MAFGLLNRCVGLLLPFIVHTVLIYRFGALYLGMNSLLSSIFQVLNLAELMFGSAVVYSLYKPVAEGDTETVCAYLGTYRKIYRDMRRFNFIYMLLAGWAMICLLCLYQPFVRLWVESSLMLGWPEVVVLCLYFYLLKAGDMRWIYHQGAGLWWKARYIVIAEILCNVVLNILLAKYWGVLGIIVATLISLFFINFLGGAWILFKEYFCNDKLGEFFGDQALYFGVTLVLAVMCVYACDGVIGLAAGFAGMGTEYGAISSVNGKLLALAGLFVRLVFCTLVSVVGYYLAYHRTMRYIEAKEWVRSRFWKIKEWG